eukprot:jgi/Picsp_1/6641/NSC_03984-R1_glycosyltransferase family 32 protein
MEWWDAFSPVLGGRNEPKPLLPRVSSVSKLNQQRLGLHHRSASTPNFKGSHGNLSHYHYQQAHLQQQCSSRLHRGIVIFRLVVRSLVVLTMLLFLWYLFLGAGGALPESINLKHRMTIDGPRIMKNVEHWIEFSGGVDESLLESVLNIRDDAAKVAAWEDGQSTMIEAWKQTKEFLIPRTIHYVYDGGDREGEKELEALYRDLSQANQGWEIRMYDVGTAASYVEKWFPVYSTGFNGLKSKVERENMYRYLIVLKYGGVMYSESKARVLNMTEVIHPKDAFVSVHVRQRGLRHDLFAAVANHPILSDLSSRIVSSAEQISKLEFLESMESTGDGIFTDTVLEYALDKGRSKSRAQQVRLLPAIAFSQRSGQPCRAPWSSEHGEQIVDSNLKSKTSIDFKDDLNSELYQEGNLGISKWLAREQRPQDRGAVKAIGNSATDMQELKTKVVSYVEKIAGKEAVHRLTPVSCPSDPPFDVLTHAVGVGEWHAGSDVSAALKSFGAWQPSVQPLRSPSLTDVIVGSLSYKSKSKGRKLLVDIGAGYGVVSLAAAARGHRVRAYEVGSRSFEALKESIKWNAFHSLIRLEDQPFGSEEDAGQDVCLRPKGNVSLSSDVYRQQQRGYGRPEDHQIPRDECLISKTRTSGARVFEKEAHIDALKISAEGWGGSVLEGFMPFLQHREKRPPVVSLEWNPGMMRSVGFMEPLDILKKMEFLGYQNISHSGYICDERWSALTYNVRKRGSITSLTPNLKRPTWCRLHQEDFELLLKIGELAKSLETILFLDMRGSNSSST